MIDIRNQRKDQILREREYSSFSYIRREIIPTRHQLKIKEIYCEPTYDIPQNPSQGFVAIYPSAPSKKRIPPNHSTYIVEGKGSDPGGWGTYTNDTTSSTTTCIASLQTLLIPALSKIIFPSMNNNHPSNNTLRTNQFDVLILDSALCCARRVGINVAQIAYMTSGSSGTSVRSIMRIEMGAYRSVSTNLKTKSGEG